MPVVAFQSEREADRAAAVGSPLVHHMSRAGLLAIAFSVGGLVGLVAGGERERGDTRGSVTGACIALVLSRAHGGMEELHYRRILRQLTSESSTHWDLFKTSYKEMANHCAAIAAARP